MALFRYPGKKTWWYEFHFAGQKVRESAKTKSKTMARRAEQARRRKLEEGYHGLKKRAAPKLFSAASQEWLTFKKPGLAERSYIIEEANLKHLLPVFGPLLISDIDGKDISRYQQQRLAAGASPKTVNLEVGTIRAILRKNRLWAEIQPDVRMLPTHDDIGRALTPEEEQKILQACSESRSRSLLPAVTLALNTCMRYSEVRLLRWKQVDFVARTITVGKSKSESGRGRVIPLAPQGTSSWRALTGPIRRNRSADGRKPGNPHALGPAFNVDSTIYDTRDARACWRRVRHSRFSLPSWVGVQPLQCAWRSGTGTSEMVLLGVRSSLSHSETKRETNPNLSGTPLTIPLT